MHFLANKKVVIISMITTLIMAYIVMVVFDPMVDGKDGLSVIALQLAFEKSKGIQIVSSWDIEAFNKGIVLDYLYALSYMVFFASLVAWLEKKRDISPSLFPYIALSAGVFDWIENSLELWFLHDVEAFSSTLFFIHSIFSTLKWLALPIVIWRIVMLFKARGINV